LISDERWTRFERKQSAVSRETSRAAAARIGPLEAAAYRPSLSRDYSLLDLMRRPATSYDRVWSWQGESKGASRASLRAELGRSLADQVIEQVEVSARYSGYIDKQHEQIARSLNAENTRLPDGMNYGNVHALSFEARQVLARHRPATIGLASRLPGITPAAISLLLVHLKKHRQGGESAANDDDALRASA
jgi:tRNA uridine 5-carboxymethylaminomethyl modification enzyme